MALATRAGWGTIRLYQADNPAALEFPDEEQYWLMAGSLVVGEGLQDELGFRATRMPLYPSLLAVFARLDHGVVVAKVFHWLLGAGVAVVTALAAAAIFDRRVALAAGLLVALDPFLVFFSSLLLTETLFAGVLAALWWVSWPLLAPQADGERARGREEEARLNLLLRRWCVVGVLAALAVYVRESALGLVLLLLLLILGLRRFSGRAMLGSLLVYGIVFAALAPWAARNFWVTGEWSWLTNRAGISLYDGVRPGATGASDLGNVKQMPAVRDLSEVEWNRYFLRRSLEVMKNDPVRIIRLAGVKLARMWNPLPNVETYQSVLARAVSAAWVLPTFALAVAGAALLPITDPRAGWRKLLFLLLPALYLSALHSVFVGSVRYRLGAIPMLEILAAFAVVSAAAYVPRRFGNEGQPRPEGRGK